jgi:PqqD family protein of HPr-rel-A system
VSAAPLPLHCWDGEYVVYNPLSGDTHFLDIVTGEILRAITAGPAAAVELRRFTAQFLEVPDDDRIAAHVSGTLAKLDDLGLIEPAGPC